MTVKLFTGTLNKNKKNKKKLPPKIRCIKYKDLTALLKTVKVLSIAHQVSHMIIFCLLLFAGMSNSGKTTYIKTLLEQADKIFTEKPSRIIYFYNVYQSKFSEMEASIPNKTFYQGLPQRRDIEKYADTEKHLLMVFDDLYQEVISSCICAISQ